MVKSNIKGKLREKERKFVSGIMRDVVENERKGYERGGREKEKERGVVESERREKCETVNEQRW